MLNDFIFLIYCSLTIRGTANKWICSYLMNRYQYVTINGTNSEYMNVLCGVPQGSILGPILFILYINDMCNVSTLLKPILFAYDTNLFYSGKDIEEEEECCLFDHHHGSGGYIKTQYKSLTCRPPKYIQFSYVAKKINIVN